MGNLEAVKLNREHVGFIAPAAHHHESRAVARLTNEKTGPAASNPGNVLRLTTRHRAGCFIRC